MNAANLFKDDEREFARMAIVTALLIGQAGCGLAKVVGAFKTADQIIGVTLGEIDVGSDRSDNAVGNADSASQGARVVRDSLGVG